MRKEMPIVQEGLFYPLLEEDEKIFAYERKYQDESLICVNNFYPETAAFTLPLEGYEVILSNYEDVTVSDTMELRPYETIVLYKK